MAMFFSMVLKVLVRASAILVNRVPHTQSIENPGGKAAVNNVVGPVSYDARTLDRQRTVLPPLQPEQLFIELVWKGLCPPSEIFPDVFVEYLLQGKAIPDLLVTCRFVNKSNNAHFCKRSYQCVAIESVPLFLCSLELPCISRVKDHFANLEQNCGLVSCGGLRGPRTHTDEVYWILDGHL